MLTNQSSKPDTEQVQQSTTAAYAAENIAELIGKTPLVKINHLNTNKNVNIYAKLEGFNPSGSIKDRVAFEMIKAAEASGALTKNKMIIEPSSGNTGIGLAMIAAAKGYNITVVMSESVSIERRKILQAYGAKIILTDPKLGTDGAILKVHELVKKDPAKYFFPNQFSNKNNILVHYNTTGREIVQSVPDIDIFVAGLGTSGTLMGVSKYLKEHVPGVKIISAEPKKDHHIQGLKNMGEAIVPEIFNPHMIDERLTIQDEDAFEMAKLLAREEGLFVGMSSGAAMCAALKAAQKLESGNIVVIFPDRGDKYLSTTLFE